MCLGSQCWARALRSDAGIANCSGYLSVHSAQVLARQCVAATVLHRRCQMVRSTPVFTTFSFSKKQCTIAQASPGCAAIIPPVWCPLAVLLSKFSSHEFSAPITLCASTVIIPLVVMVPHWLYCRLFQQRARLLFQSHSVACVGTSSRQATIITIHNLARLLIREPCLILVQVPALGQVLALGQVQALVQVLALLQQVAGCSNNQRLHQQLTRPSTVCLIFI